MVLIYQYIITNTDLTQLTQKKTIIVTIDTVVFLSSIYWMIKGDIKTHPPVQLDSRSCVPMPLSFYLYLQCHANVKVSVIKQNKKHKFFYTCYLVYYCSIFNKFFASEQVVVGGNDGSANYIHHIFSSVEIFPSPSSDTCFIPDLPQPRTEHSLSLLSWGRLVVCGGLIPSFQDVARSCIIWAPGSSSWTHMHAIRSSNYFFYADLKLIQQQRKIFPCGVDTTISPRLHCASWRL